MAMVEPYVAELRTKHPDTKLYEYLQPTYRDKYNLGLTRDLPGDVYLDVADTTVRAELARRCKHYVARTGVDGIMLDTPFEVAPGTELAAAQLCADIQTAISPAGALVNFGDYATWTNENNVPELRRKAQAGLGQLMPYQLVEVGLDVSRFTQTAWDRARGRMTTMLGRGKTVVFGIYDPAGQRAQLAALLACAYTHERLYYLYKTQAETPEEEQWNPWYAVAR